MTQTTQIALRSTTTTALFDWSSYDGDDCFEIFRIIVSAEGETQQFDFGPCAIRAVRMMKEFLADDTKAEVGGGFRNPDIRYYDIYRSMGRLRIVIRFEGSGLNKEFIISDPDILITGDPNLP